MKMNTLRFIALVSTILPILALYPLHTKAEEAKNIRPPILAGKWYPGTRDALTKRVEGLLAGVATPIINGELKAIIVPHAGYMYSGSVAAYAYKILRDTPFRRIILLGPSHRVTFKGASVNLQRAYKTPLGIVPVDQEIARKIINLGKPGIKWLRQAHAFEHSLEIQLPFLQRVLERFKIVPIVMGQQDYKTCLDLSKILVQALGNSEETLILASSDLSHYHTYDQARALDLEFIKHVKAFDSEALNRALSTGKCEACGRGPVITTMLAARKMGAGQSNILNYANSGDITGDRNRVVGYLAAALVRSSDRDQRPR